MQRLHDDATTAARVRTRAFDGGARATARARLARQGQDTLPKYQYEGATTLYDPLTTV